MRKFLKGLPFKKVFVFLFVSLYTFLPSLQAFGVVIEDYASEDVSVGVDEGGDILDEGISDPEEIANPNVLEEEVVEEEVVEEPLFVYEDGVYTVHKVVVGEEYVYPDNKDVRIKFTNVTEEGDLVISRVTLTEQQKEELNTSDDYGWDISSSMDNGSFTYDLTLPNNTESNDVEVKYTEDGEIYTSIDDAVVDKDVINIEGLDHFTIFVVTGVDNTGNCEGASITEPSGTTECYSTIQAAIDAATPGDEVLVSEGTYILPEGIVINKENLTLKALGEVIVRYSSDETAESPYNLIGISVLANMGTVTVQGFKVAGYETGIAQGMSQSAGTEFHVIDNTVYPGFKDGRLYMRNGIQVTGDGSTVIGNTVYGAPLTDDWAGTAIGVVNASNVLVENNVITDTFFDIGIGILNYSNAGGISNITVINNSITNAKTSLSLTGKNNTYLVSDVKFENNTISGPANNSVWVYGLNIQTVTANRILLKNNTITFNSDWTKEIRISPTSAIASNTIIDNGAITGTIIPDGSGAINTDLDYAGFAEGLTLVAQIIGEEGNLTHFNGTISGLIDATVTGSINANGYDSLSAVLNIDGITYPVRLLGDFAQAGYTGGFTGRIVTGNYGPYAESIEIEAPKTVIGVGENLQLSIIPDIKVAWTIYVNDQEIASVDQTGLVTGLEEGTFTVIAIAQDGSLLDDTILIRVDGTPPSMTNYALSDSLLNYSENSIVLTGDIVDEWSSIESVKFAIWNSDKSQVFKNWTSTNAEDGAYDSTEESTHHTIDISAFPEGDYVLGVRGWDMSGNKASGGDHYFTIDRTAPAVPTGLYFTEKGSSEIKNCGDYTNSEYGSFIHWDENNEEDFLRFEYISYNSNGTTGPVREFTSNEFDATWWKRPSDGQYGFQLRSVDTAGNKSEWTSLCSVNVDWQAPTGTIDSIYYSSKDMYLSHFKTNDNTPEIHGTASDNSGTYSAGVKIGTYDSISLAGGPGFWSAGFSNPIPDGIYPIVLTLRDPAGNETVIEQDITIDTIAPTALHTYFKNGVEIIDPMAYVKGTSDLTFLAEYYEEGSGIYQDSYVIFDSNDEGTARTSKAYCGWRKPGNTLLITENPLTTPVPFTNCSATLLDGEYFMYHQVYDNATRQDIPTINQFRDHKGLHFIVDSLAPTSTITTPSSGYITNEEPEIIGYTEDTYSVDKVVLSYTDYDTDTQQCGTDWTELTTIINNDKELLPFDWSYSEWNLEDGAYCIKAQGTDLAGNEENTAIIENVIYDTTPPQITLLDLVLGVLREVDANDPLSGIYKIQVSKDNKTTWEDYTPNMNLNDLVGNQPGTYTIYIKVTDNAGNTTDNNSVTFTIPSPTLTTTPTAGDVLGAATENKNTEGTSNSTTPSSKLTPVNAYNPTYLLSQTDEQNTDEEEITEEETTTQDSPEVKGEEDNEEQNGEEEPTEEEQTKWWVYPLVILPVLAIFLILWKRRKEDNEPQF